jgi:hypothetical protein
MTQADRVHSTPPTNTSAIQAQSSRRRFLVQAAGVAAGGAALGMAMPLPAPAATPQGVPDPILAAIERHRAAFDAHTATLGEDELEAAILPERRLSAFYNARFGDADWRVETDDPAWIAHIEESCRAGDEEDAAAAALISVEDLSPAGAIALLNYALYHEERGESWPNLEDESGKLRSWHFFLLELLAGALPGIVGVV